MSTRKCRTPYWQLARGAVQLNSDFFSGPEITADESIWHACPGWSICSFSWRLGCRKLQQEAHQLVGPNERRSTPNLKLAAGVVHISLMVILRQTVAKLTVTYRTMTSLVLWKMWAQSPAYQAIAGRRWVSLIGLWTNIANQINQSHSIYNLRSVTHVTDVNFSFLLLAARRSDSFFERYLSSYPGRTGGRMETLLEPDK